LTLTGALEQAEVGKPFKARASHPRVLADLLTSMLAPESSAAGQAGSQQSEPEGSDVDSGDDEDVDMDDLEALDGDDIDGIARGFDADGGAAARDRARAPREPRAKRARGRDRPRLTEAQLAHRVNMVCEVFEAVFEEARGKKPHAGALSSLAAFAIYDKARSVAAVDRLQVTAPSPCARCSLPLWCISRVLQAIIPSAPAGHAVYKHLRRMRDDYAKERDRRECTIVDLRAAEDRGNGWMFMMDNVMQSVNTNGLRVLDKTFTAKRAPNVGGIGTSMLGVEIAGVKGSDGTSGGRPTCSILSATDRQLPFAAVSQLQKRKDLMPGPSRDEPPKGASAERLQAAGSFEKLNREECSHAHAMFLRAALFVRERCRTLEFDKGIAHMRDKVERAHAAATSQARTKVCTDCGRQLPVEMWPGQPEPGKPDKRTGPRTCPLKLPDGRAHGCGGQLLSARQQVHSGFRQSEGNGGWATIGSSMNPQVEKELKIDAGHPLPSLQDSAAYGVLLVPGPTARSKMRAVRPNDRRADGLAVPKYATVNPELGEPEATAACPTPLPQPQPTVVKEQVLPALSKNPGSEEGLAAGLAVLERWVP
jgi:hypothetical protein